MGELIVFHHNLLKRAKKTKNRKWVKMQDKCQIVQDFPKYILSVNLTFFLWFHWVILQVSSDWLFDTGKYQSVWHHITTFNADKLCDFETQSTNKGGQINFSVIRSWTIIEMQALWIDVNIENTGIQWIWGIWCHSLALFLKSTTIWSCKFSCMVIRCQTFWNLFPIFRT